MGADTAGDRPALLTFGHGTASQEKVVELLRGAGVERLVDVRRFPGSRNHPHVARDVMEQWLPATGVGYRWDERLGGRRRAGEEAARDSWWQVEQFRAYAAHMRGDEFRAALDELLDGVRSGTRTAVMCSETVWWRCHRRLIADATVLLHDLPVLHLGHDGRLAPHRPSEGARVTDDGLVYDAPRENP